MKEFNFPREQYKDQALNFLGWDDLLYTRGFEAVNSARALRHVSKVLTYPLTIGSVLHELSTLRLNHRLLPEGLRSLTALRYNLHPVPGSNRETTPIRIFIVGARAEATLPRALWMQMAYLFPGVDFHIHFIGPEAAYDRRLGVVNDPDELPRREVYNRQLSFSTYVESFHTLHKAGTFAPYDPYYDVFFLFSPGLGYPASSAQWAPSVPGLLESKCAIFSTAFSAEDLQRDLAWVERECEGEYDLLLTPGINAFRSLKYDMSNTNIRDVMQANWGMFAFRGRRYVVTEKHPL